MIRNFPRGEVMPLKNMLMYGPGQSLSKNFVETENFSMEMYSLWKDGELQIATQDRYMFITCLEGAVIVSVSGKEVYIVRAEESLLLPGNEVVRIVAKENCKFVMINTK